MKYAINTNCLKNNFSRQEIVEIARNADLQGIEWGLSALVDAAKDASEMTMLTEDAGLEVVSFINAPHCYKLDLMKQWSEAVAGANGKILRVSPPWYAWDYDEAIRQNESFLHHLQVTRDGLIKLQELSKEFGIRYVIEIHSGSIAASPWGIKYLMDGLDPQAVGTIWDPANMMIEGNIRPTASMELLGEYLSYVHVKNLEWSRKVDNSGWEIIHKTIDCGLVNYKEIIFALKKFNYAGWLSFEELCTGKENVLPEITNAVTFLNKCINDTPGKTVEPYLNYNF
jgi:sugar phosphate isomerase/epimerase